MPESGVDILEEIPESESEHIEPDLKPRSSAVPQKVSERIESLESKRSKNSLGRKAALTLAAIMALKGVGETANDITNAAKGEHINNTPPITEEYKAPASTAERTDSESTSGPIPEPTPESERAKYQMEIEEKYGIEILNQREGYERVGKEYDESNEERLGNRPVIRWSEEQLTNVNIALSYLPVSFYAPGENGQKFAISLWDYGSAEEWFGAYHGWANLISANEYAFTNKNSTKEHLSFLAHEFGHRMDSDDLKRRLDEILGNNDFVSNKYYLDANSSGNPDMEQSASTLKDFVEKEGNEGRANFFQTYIKGYDRFMKAVGPVIDGGEFNFTDPRELLAEKYPRAQKIYDLYKEIFEGREYDEIQDEIDPNFRYPEDNINTEFNKKDEFYWIRKRTENTIELTDSRPAQIGELEKKHDLGFINFSEDSNIEDIYTLDAYLSTLPSSFFARIDNRRVSLVLVDKIDNIMQKHDGHAIYLTRESINSRVDINGPSDAVVFLAHELTHRFNEMNGYEPQQDVVNILGGKNFLNNPEKMYPRLFKKSKLDMVEEVRQKFFKPNGMLVNPDEITAILGELYVRGEWRFNITMHLFDKPNLIPPKLRLSNMTEGEKEQARKEEREIIEKSTYYKLYKYFQNKVFENLDYYTSSKGLPSPHTVTEEKN